MEREFYSESSLFLFFFSPSFSSPSFSMSVPRTLAAKWRQTGLVESADCQRDNAPHCYTAKVLSVRVYTGRSRKLSLDINRQSSARKIASWRVCRFVRRCVRPVAHEITDLFVDRARDKGTTRVGEKGGGGWKAGGWMETELPRSIEAHDPSNHRLFTPRCAVCTRYRYACTFFFVYSSTSYTFQRDEAG